MRNLLAIYQAFTESTDDDMRAHFSGMRYGDLKKHVAEAVVGALEPVQSAYREIMAEPGYVARVLAKEPSASADREGHGEHSEEGDGLVYGVMRRGLLAYFFLLRLPNRFSVQNWLRALDFCGRHRDA